MSTAHHNSTYLVAQRAMALESSVNLDALPVNNPPQENEPFYFDAMMLDNEHTFSLRPDPLFKPNGLADMLAHCMDDDDALSFPFCAPLFGELVETTTVCIGCVIGDKASCGCVPPPEQVPHQTASDSTATKTLDDALNAFEDEHVSDEESDRQVSNRQRLRRSPRLSAHSRPPKAQRNPKCETKACATVKQEGDGLPVWLTKGADSKEMEEWNQDMGVCEVDRAEYDDYDPSADESPQRTRGRPKGLKRRRICYSSLTCQPALAEVRVKIPTKKERKSEFNSCLPDDDPEEGFSPGKLLSVPVWLNEPVTSGELQEINEHWRERVDPSHKESVTRLKVKSALPDYVASGNRKSKKAVKAACSSQLTRQRINIAADALDDVLPPVGEFADMRPGLTRTVLRAHAYIKYLQHYSVAHR